MLRLTKMLLAAGLITLIASLAVACGGGDDNGDDLPADGLGQGGSDQQPSAQLEISALNLLFDKDRLVAPPNTEVSLVFNNNDAGVLHNVSVYRSRNAEEPIFTGELFVGVDTRTYRFETPEAGSYFFRCDSHPDTMNGSFVVR